VSTCSTGNAMGLIQFANWAVAPARSIWPQDYHCDILRTVRCNLPCHWAESAHIISSTAALRLVSLRQPQEVLRMWLPSRHLYCADKGTNKQANKLARSHTCGFAAAAGAGAHCPSAQQSPTTTSGWWVPTLSGFTYTVLDAS
jgi:hypothetical protein